MSRAKHDTTSPRPSDREHEPRWHGTEYGGGRMVCRCGDACEDGYIVHAEVVHDAQIRELETQVAGLMTTNAHLEAQLVGLQTTNTEKAAEIRRLRMGNHPAGRALRLTDDIDANIIALREALTERDAEHEGGEGA